MTVSGVLTTGLTAASTSGDKNSPEKIKAAATQFEALLIGQVLKSVHEEGSGWLGTGDDQTSSSTMGMADEYLAQSMSKNGGFGLAKMISEGLDRRAALNNSSPATDSNPEDSANKL